MAADMRITHGGGYEGDVEQLTAVTSASLIVEGMWVMCHFSCLMAFPILTDRGRHCVRKLKKKHLFKYDIVLTLKYSAFTIT